MILTGSDGYLGARMAGHLIRQGFEVVGIDSGLHRVGWFYHCDDPRPATITRDIRNVEAADLEGFDTVVHLAEISNDPVGELNQDVTYQVNHAGTVRLARLARDAGIRRFVHMSSCSVYGQAGDHDSRETDPVEPLTAYARCKVLVEQDVGSLADDDFAPVFLRNATVFGASPRQRFDLVVNDLTATAFLDREIRMSSDGSPWRPFVHVLDVAQAVGCVLRASEHDVRGQILNVGANSLNQQIRDIAELVGSLVPGCEVHTGPPSDDRRDYRADFTKISSVLPDFSCDWTIEDGVRELLDIMARTNFDESQYRWRGHWRIAQIRHLRETGQIDEDLFWTAA